MTDLAMRFSTNPVITPEQVTPSIEGFEVTCAFNPGAFEYQGRIGLVLRVAERPVQNEITVSTPVLDEHGSLSILEFRRDDPKLETGDPRGFTYDGRDYLTTLSHLRLAWSDDGEHFQVEAEPCGVGLGKLETFGLEDARVTQIDGSYYLTYTAVSSNGFGVGMRSTTDWKNFTHHGMVIPPANKDCALFPEKIGGYHYMLHRPTGGGLGGNMIWLARSPDLEHWGHHQCIAKPRAGSWDETRIGAGAAPICTDDGWLEVYHGADHNHRYCLGAMLLDIHDPSKVLARSIKPIMEPSADYERTGFFGNVVFNNGNVVRGDELIVYYGAADSVSCGARFSIQEILKTLS
jgi:beta-1,2-mannobiose phosphorylase / 1,2-beta-oligomannan phosphorylase